MDAAMASMGIGELAVLALETMLVSLGMKIMSGVITVILFVNMAAERNLCCFFRASYSYFLEKRERILTCKCYVYIMCMYKHHTKGGRIFEDCNI